ncbi:MAG: hypothetical protein ACYC5Q_10595 [Thermoleophilia bacterium]
MTGKLDALARHWHGAPRRWGHPLHSLCSYFAMFPPHIPRVFVEWLTVSGDVVYDPFSGRGTAPMEACRLGRIGLGSDANPLAYVLTGAKVNPPTAEAVGARLDALEASMPARRLGGVPDDIRMLYSPKVLRQLCWLRGQLDIDDRTDRFIMSTILGLLHANHNPGSPARGLSISMPNTFSMSPGYVRSYIAEHCLKPPDVDVIDMVRRKIDRMCIPISAARRGRAWKADARHAGDLREGLAKLVFTSPPYLGVIKYGKYNWIRLWMLGYDAREVDGELLATASLRRYLDFIAEVLLGFREVVRPDGYVCLMLGDVRDKSSGATLNLAEKVWRNTAAPAGWRRLGVLNDHLPEQHKVSRIWGHEKKGQATKVDRILILAPPGSSHSLPRRPRGFVWNTAHEWAQSPTEEA